MTYYQRKKQENAKIIADLQQEIEILVFQPDSFKADLIRTGYFMLKEQNEQLMYGVCMQNIKG